MSSVMLHKLNALLLFLPELDVAIRAACDKEVAACHLNTGVVFWLVICFTGKLSGCSEG